MYPILYLVARDKPSYVLATIHVGVGALGKIPDRLLETIGHSRSFHTEVKPRTAPEHNIPTGELLNSAGEESLRQFGVVCARYKLDHKELFAAPIDKTLHALLHAAMPAYAGEILDYHLADEAEKRGVQHKGMENADGNFDGVALSDLLLNSIETLFHDEGTTLKQFRLVIEAFKDGHEIVLRDVVDKLIESQEDTETTEKLNEWNGRRNRVMARAILNEREPAFFAVGYKHLMGKENVIDILRREHGLTVERVFFDFQECQGMGKETCSASP